MHTIMLIAVTLIANNTTCLTLERHLNLLDVLFYRQQLILIHFVFWKCNLRVSHNTLLSMCNWIKTLHYRIFKFPRFFESQTGLITAKFEHLEEIFQSELHQPVKIAYKLNFKLLHPGPIDRQSVLHAQSVFHESTVNALNFYGEKNNNPGFLETAIFINIILTWWKNVNVKSKFSGQKSKDNTRNPVHRENLTEKTRFVIAISIHEHSCCQHYNVGCCHC